MISASFRFQSVEKHGADQGFRGDRFRNGQRAAHERMQRRAWWSYATAVPRRVCRLIRPYPDFYSAFTTAIHGLTRRDTEDAPLFPDVWAEIAPQIEGLPPVAHNSSFDEGCLRAVHAHYGLPYPDCRFLCTLSASRRRIKGCPANATESGFFRYYYAEQIVRIVGRCSKLSFQL